MDLKLHQISLIIGSTIVLIILMAITKKVTRKVSLVKKLEPHRKK